MVSLGQPVAEQVEQPDDQVELSGDMQVEQERPQHVANEVAEAHHIGRIVGDVEVHDTVQHEVHEPARDPERTLLVRLPFRTVVVHLAEGLVINHRVERKHQVREHEEVRQRATHAGVSAVRRYSTKVDHEAEHEDRAEHRPHDSRPRGGDDPGPRERERRSEREEEDHPYRHPHGKVTASDQDESAADQPGAVHQPEREADHHQRYQHEEGLAQSGRQPRIYREANRGDQHHPKERLALDAHPIDQPGGDRKFHQEQQLREPGPGRDRRAPLSWTDGQSPSPRAMMLRWISDVPE